MATNPEPDLSILPPALFVTISAEGPYPKAWAATDRLRRLIARHMTEVATSRKTETFWFVGGWDTNEGFTHRVIQHDEPGSFTIKIKTPRWMEPDNPFDEWNSWVKW